MEVESTVYCRLLQLLYLYMWLEYETKFVESLCKIDVFIIASKACIVYALL